MRFFHSEVNGRFRDSGCISAHKEIGMSDKVNPKQTSPEVASQAGRDLADPKTPKKDRAPIASALAQAKPNPKK